MCFDRNLIHSANACFLVMACVGYSRAQLKTLSSVLKIGGRGRLRVQVFHSEHVHKVWRPTFFEVRMLRTENSYSKSRSLLMLTLGTLRSENEDDYEYEFSILSMRIRFGGQHFSKCACSDILDRYHLSYFKLFQSLQAATKGKMN